MSNRFNDKKLIFVQPALPNYRVDFFERLYGIFGDRLKVYYSYGSLGVLTKSVDRPWACQVGGIKNIGGVVAWQFGVVGIPFEKGDLLILSGNPRQLSTLALLVNAKLQNIKTVWWGHYWSSSSRRWRQILRFFPMALSDATLFYTDDEVERFKSDRFAIRRKKLTLALNNGLDDTSIKKERIPYSAFNRERALLFIGRLTAKANLELAIKALSKLGDNAPDLHVVGSGEKENSLKLLASSLDLSGSVYWHGASTNEEFISSIANKCRAFVYPGEVGLSLIHGMIYGLPAIVHDQKRVHMPEIAAFENGVTGLSFSMGDHDSLAAVLRDNIDNFEYLDKLSKNSVVKVSKDYTTKSMVERFCQLVGLLEADV